jgi:hypothetical protein
MRSSRPHVAAMVDHSRARAAQNPNGWKTRVWSEREILNECWGDLPPSLSDPLVAVLAVCPSHAARSDVLRAVLLWSKGGVYLDADMMLLTPDFDWVLGYATLPPSLAVTHSPHMARADRLLFGSGTNNCFIAAAPRHPVIRALLEEMATAPAFECSSGTLDISASAHVKKKKTLSAEEDSPTPPFPCTTIAARNWTIAHTGPGLLARVVSDPAWEQQRASGEFRFLPTSQILMLNRGVTYPRTASGEVDTVVLERQILASHPSSIAAHVSDNSWVSDAMVRAKKAGLGVRDFFYEGWWVAILVLLACVVLLVAGVVWLKRVTMTDAEKVARLKRKLRSALSRK